MSQLIVPIRLDALILGADRWVAGPTADFSRLPYYDPRLEREINADNPFISEEVVAQPFRSESFNLRAGVHLHWSLPDALTEGRSVDGKASFPAVPNRWLVRRTGTLATRSWVVESDYVHPLPERSGAGDGSPYVGGAGADAITYYTRQLHLGSDGVSNEPFRYLGRRRPFDEWLQEPSDPGDYLPADEPLTAVGYGHVAFAAFYPNCHSVFGFHDGEAAGATGDLVYRVIGWYSDPARADALLARGRFEQLGWTVPEAEQDQPPGRPPKGAGLVFYSRLACASKAGGGPEEPAGEGALTIAAGNTTMEALSTLLASRLAERFQADGDDRKWRQAGGKTTAAAARERLEDQLEWLHLSPKLASRKLDIGPRFREARHESGFQRVPAGKYWAIRTESPTGAGAGETLHSARAQEAQTQRRLIPPAEMRARLSALNALQWRWNELQSEIAGGRRQLFADWYKYMLSTYHPQDTVRGDDYPDVDRVRHFIQRRDTGPSRGWRSRSSPSRCTSGSSGRKASSPRS